MPPPAPAPLLSSPSPCHLLPPPLTFFVSVSTTWQTTGRRIHREVGDPTTTGGSIARTVEQLFRFLRPTTIERLLALRLYHDKVSL